MSFTTRTIIFLVASAYVVAQNQEVTQPSVVPGNLTEGNANTTTILDNLNTTTNLTLFETNVTTAMGISTNMTNNITVNFEQNSTTTSAVVTTTELPTTKEPSGAATIVSSAVLLFSAIIMCSL